VSHPASLRRGMVVMALGVALGTSAVVASSSAPTLAASATPTVLVSDSFSRGVTDAWGQADTGGAYSLFGTRADYDVAAGVGSMRLPAPRTTRRAILGNVVARDVDLSVRVKVNRLPARGGSGQYAYLVARHQAGGAEEQAHLRIGSDGNVYLGAGHTADGTVAGATPLATEVRVRGLVATPNTWFRLRLQIVGTNPTTLRLRLWRDGSTEPQTWPFVATDKRAALQRAGTIGLMAYVSLPTANAPVTFRFDDLRAVAAPPPAVPSIVDLGTLGGTHAIARGINDLGQVVGDAAVASGNDRAFLWDKGTMTDLGSLNGEPDGSFAAAINNRGQIVGGSQTADVQSHAFLWQRGTMTDLGTLGGPESQASAINESGQVVGTASTPSGDIHAFLWQDGRMTDLTPDGGFFTVALDINESGQVLGGGASGAFLWDHGTVTDLAGLNATSINDRGQIAGAIPTGPGARDFHAALWQDGTITDLGTLGGSFSLARGINARGQVAGYSTVASGRTHAFLWQDGTMIDLGTLGGPASLAMGINADGRVVGSSSYAPNPYTTDRAVLWHQ
jgi:probable HAF family extracellular repeat protein